MRSSERYGCIKGTVDEGGAAGAARGSMSGFVERAFSVSDSGVSGVGWGGPVGLCGGRGIGGCWAKANIWRVRVDS